MRILNMNAIFLIFIGTIVRISYFGSNTVYEKEEVTDEKTNKKYTTFAEKTEKELPMFYITTIFVLPALIALFILVELDVKKNLCQNFHFLKYPIGKGVFLLMLALMQLEKVKAVEVIFGFAILAISILNIVVGFLKRDENVDEETADEEMPLT